jgi:hypothetical protein
VRGHAVAHPAGRGRAVAAPGGRRHHRGAGRLGAGQRGRGLPGRLWLRAAGAGAGAR